jgi:RNA polymerase-binding transcription factor DksA
MVLTPQVDAESTLQESAASQVEEEQRIPHQHSNTYRLEQRTGTPIPRHKHTLLRLCTLATRCQYISPSTQPTHMGCRSMFGMEPF